MTKIELLQAIANLGGETRDLAFHVYHYTKRPFSLVGCTANFAVTVTTILRSPGAGR